MTSLHFTKSRDGARRSATLSSLALAAAFVVGCKRSDGGDSPEPPRDAPAQSAASAPVPAPAPAPPASASVASKARDRAPEPTVTELTRSDGEALGVELSELSDIGPAGPATATPEGVVMTSRRDELVIARSGKKPLREGKLEPVAGAPADYRALGRGPSVALGFAYWISSGRLVRLPLAGGALEVVADGARTGTRVATAVLEGKLIVGFIGRPDLDGTSRAELILPDHKRISVTPDGAGASSIALAVAGGRVLAVTIDGRSAMTPLHVRPVATDGRLSPDVVAWVAGPAHTFTEVFASSDGERAWAHLPIERDATHFGLATLLLGAAPSVEPPVTFHDYPNGLDLAPVATATVCGEPLVALAKPATAVPHGPQELVLTRAGGREEVPLASASGFAQVSLADVPGGGLVAYVADGRTWARGMRCRAKKSAAKRAP